MAVAPINIAEVSKARRFVRSFSTRAWIPILLTEACVEAGRTYNAYQRGGFTEARERITEEFSSAVIWLGGVPFFSKLIDRFVGKGVLNLPGEGKRFDVGADAARNPVANYMHEAAFKGKDPKKVESMLGNYKSGRLVSSVLLAILAVGVALPKVNQAITRRLKKNQNEHNIKNDTVKPYNNGMNSFLNGNPKDKVTFTGAFNGAKLMNFVNTFENTPKYGLIAEDGGVLVGRTSNARNRYEAIEIAFRDLASTFFYMFSTAVFATGLNKIMGGSRIDPVSSEAVSRHLIDMLGENGKMSVKEFSEAALGDVHMINDKMTSELSREIEANGGRIELEKFLEKFPELKSEAKKMSELQPQMFIDGASEAKSILTKKQIESLFSGGKINSPEFLKDLYIVQTSSDEVFNKAVKSSYNDKYAYVKLSELEASQKPVKTFVEDIIKSAKKKGVEITKEFIEKQNKKVLYKQGFAWGSSFLVSIVFLAMLIPKTQYWITKKLTGSNEFPGTAEYKENS